MIFQSSPGVGWVSGRRLDPKKTQRARRNQRAFYAASNDQLYKAELAVKKSATGLQLLREESNMVNS